MVAPARPASSAAEKDVPVAQAVDVDAHGVGRGRVLADRAQVQARSGAVDPVPGGGHEQVADVGQDALVGEEDGPDDGDLRQHRAR